MVKLHRVKCQGISHVCLRSQELDDESRSVCDISQINRVLILFLRSLIPTNAVSLRGERMSNAARTKGPRMMRARYVQTSMK